MIRSDQIFRQKRWLLSLLGLSLVLGASATSIAAEPDTGTKKLFATACAPCHGDDGRARTRAARVLGVKDLTLSKTSDEELLKQIRDGKQDDKGIQKMPPFGERLEPEELKALVKFVKGLRKPE